MASLQQKRDAAKKIARQFFLLNGQPAELTDGQADIFNAPFLKEHNREQLIGPTQYGKSEALSMGILMRTTTFNEPFAIVTGSEPKSQIIMEKVIDHTFDHEYFYRQLELDKDEPLDRIRRQRNRKHLTWKRGGGVRTLTADARNRQRVKESLTGFGSKNIAEDEASLIPDDLQAMVLRMLGGHKDGYLLKIGNPFYRNHFFRTWQSEGYRKVFIDYHQALREGRYTQAFVDEMRQEPFFSVLYECLFPSDDEIDAQGWRRIITDEELEQAFAAFEMAGTPQGSGVLGIDVGGGTADTSMTIKYDNVAWLEHTNQSHDLMANVPIIKSLHEEHKFRAIVVDDVGVGHGLSSRLMELGYPVIAFKEGGAATDRARYANAKAEAYWQAGVWLKMGGGLKRADRMLEWQHIRYKEDSSSRLAIEPKAMLAAKGIKSPDAVDSFILCFAPSNIVSAGDISFL